MSSDISIIWNKALNLLKNELTEVSFNTWIKPIKPISIIDNIITIEVPNDFIRGIIQARYMSLITSILKQTTNKDYIINLVLSEQLSSQHTKTITNENNENKIQLAGLNPKYTFDTFVIGNSNRFAHAASLAVAEAPAKAYNPLFIYGGVGLGKTHLMHAIGHYILKNSKKNIKVLYVTSEKFTNQLINSIRDDKNIEFRNRYRTIDVLLIDDIQFIAGKESTQEEFFHTFNTLHEANKQIVISSDRPPKEIPTLEDRLRSRFEWGLITDIQPPDLETRVAILKKKANVEKIEIDDAVMLYIAKNIASNIRELEGALIRIAAYSSLTNKKIDMDLAKEALKDILPENKPKVITIPLIQEIVANHFNLKVEQFKSKKRTRSIAYPRQIAMYIARELTDASLPKIGEEFGGRDHTTVIHAHEKISNDLKTDDNLKEIINSLYKKIKN